MAVGRLLRPDNLSARRPARLLYVPLVVTKCNFFVTNV